MGAHSEKGTISGPLDASYTIIWSDVTQFCDFTVHGRPEVDARAETYSQNVLRRPINQVEVEIVLQAGGVQDFEWLRRNHALLLVLLGKEFLFVEAAVDGQCHSLIHCEAVLVIGELVLIDYIIEADLVSSRAGVIMNMIIMLTIDAIDVRVGGG